MASNIIMCASILIFCAVWLLVNRRYLFDRCSMNFARQWINVFVIALVLVLFLGSLEFDMPLFGGKLNIVRSEHVGWLTKCVFRWVCVYVVLNYTCITAEIGMARNSGARIESTNQVFGWRSLFYVSLKNFIVAAISLFISADITLLEKLYVTGRWF